MATRAARPRAGPTRNTPRFPLDFEVPTRADVERAHEEVVALGAVFLHDSGGERSGFRVFADPAGHPSCLCYGQSPGPAVAGSAPAVAG